MAAIMMIVIVTSVMIQSIDAYEIRWGRIGITFAGPGVLVARAFISLTFREKFIHDYQRDEKTITIKILPELYKEALFMK
jgi:hypothetical protein